MMRDSFSPAEQQSFAHRAPGHYAMEPKAQGQTPLFPAKSCRILKLCSTVREMKGVTACVTAGCYAYCSAVQYHPGGISFQEISGKVLSLSRIGQSILHVGASISPLIWQSRPSLSPTLCFITHNFLFARYNHYYSSPTLHSH